MAFSRLLAAIATVVAFILGAGVVTGCERGAGTAAIVTASIGSPEPVRVLRLPEYPPRSLSESETRTVYTQGELRMRLLDAQLESEGYSTEERARMMFQERNALRSWARSLMRNRALAELLNAFEPNVTFEELVAKNQDKGLRGDDVYNAIITSSTHSRGSVNGVLGIDPATPPPLPPVKPGS
jgi:hypothetical protein